MRRILRSALLLGLFAHSSLHAQIRVTEVTGEAEVIHASDPSSPVGLVGGEFLSIDDRVVTGLESAVQLVLGDDSVVVVRELTDMKIAEFEPGSDAVRTRLWLKAGEVSADLQHKAGSPSSDFAIKTPTATCSVRGSGMDVRHVNGQTEQATRHGETQLSTESGATDQGAGDEGTADEDGEVTTSSEMKTLDSQAPSQANGISQDERDSVLNSGTFLTNTGGGAPNDIASGSGSNAPANIFDDIFSRTDFLDDEEATVEDDGNGRGGDHGGGGDPGPGPAPFDVVVQTGDTFSFADSDDELLSLGQPSYDNGTGTTKVFFQAHTVSGGTGIFRHDESEGLTALAVTGVSLMTTGGKGSVSLFEIFDLVDADSGDVAFRAALDDTAGQGIYLINLSGNLLTIADTRGSHGLMVASFGPVDPATPVFSFDRELGTAEVAFVAETQGAMPNTSIFVGNGGTVPTPILGGGDSDTRGGTFYGAGINGFRSLDYELTDAGGGSVDRRLAFIGHSDRSFSEIRGVYVKSMPAVGTPTLTAIVDTTDVIKDTSNVAYAGNPTFTDFSSVSIDGGSVAFLGAGEVAGNPFEGVFTNRGGTLENVVNNAEPTTLFGGTSIQFEDFQTVNLTDGILTFSASTVASEDRSVYVEVAPGTGQFTPVIQSGSTLTAGTVGNVSLGVNGVDEDGGAVKVNIEGGGSVIAVSQPDIVAGGLAPLP